MKKYNAIEKQQMMVLSDLLDDSLSIDERVEIQKSNLDINKLVDLNLIKNSTVSEKLKKKNY